MAKQKTSGAVCCKYHLKVVERLEERIAELSAKVLEYEQMADDFKRAADKAEKRIAELEAQLHSTRNTLFARATDVQNLQAACECAEKERDRARARAVDLERVRDEARAYAIVEAERERDKVRVEVEQQKMLAYVDTAAGRRDLLEILRQGREFEQKLKEASRMDPAILRENITL